MSPTSASCPHCQAKLKLENSGLAGKKVKCPRCARPFMLPPANPDADVLDIEEAREVSPVAGEEDWLAALSSLDPPAPSGSNRAAPQAPPVVGKRKKKSSGDKHRSGSRFRDEDGEFPLWMHRVLMIGSGVLGGIIGTAIWAFVIYQFDLPSSYIAIFVGAFVGIGVRLGASKWDYGWGPAVTASVIAFLAIIAGKIVGMNLLLTAVQRETAEFAAAYVQLMRHENFLISQMADEILAEEFGNGVEIDEASLAIMEEFDDEDVDPEAWLQPEQLPQRYPPKVWEDAKKRWDQLPADEKQNRRAAVHAAIAQGEGEAAVAEMDFNRPALLHPLDLLFAILAIIAAFRIAAGWTDN
jgi:predicted Zn finger-like uncharacterized protein